MDSGINEGVIGLKNQAYTKPAQGFGGDPVLGLTGAKNGTEKEKITILAKEFESILVGQMLKTMRSTIDKSGFIKQGPGEEIFTEMLDEEMARQMAFSNNNGLAAKLVEQLLSISRSPENGKVDAKDSPPPNANNPEVKRPDIR